jgi:hypothetical protein
MQRWQFRHITVRHLLAATVRAGGLGPAELQLDAHHVAADGLVRTARFPQGIALRQVQAVSSQRRNDLGDLLQRLAKCSVLCQIRSKTPPRDL